MAVNLSEITSRQCSEYLASGGDLVFVPYASPERLGPHLPLGERIIVAETIADALAKRNNGLTLPAVPYGTLYDTGKQRGSVDIKAGLMHRYLYDICTELTRNTFKRIVVVGFADEAYYLAHDFFQNENIAVTTLSPDKFFDMENSVANALDAHGRELWRFAACLALSEDTEMLASVMQKTQMYFDRYEPPVNKMTEALRQMGNVPRIYGEGEWKFLPVNLGKSLEHNSSGFQPPDKALLQSARDELATWLDSLAGPVSSLREYQSYLDKHEYLRPL